MPDDNTRTILKDAFKTGKRPREQDFRLLIDSMFIKDLDTLTLSGTDPITVEGGDFGDPLISLKTKKPGDAAFFLSIDSPKGLGFQRTNKPAGQSLFFQLGDQHAITNLSALSMGAGSPWEIKPESSQQKFSIKSSAGAGLEILDQHLNKQLNLIQLNKIGFGSGDADWGILANNTRTADEMGIQKSGKGIKVGIAKADQEVSLSGLDVLKFGDGAWQINAGADNLALQKPGVGGIEVSAADKLLKLNGLDGIRLGATSSDWKISSGPDGLNIGNDTASLNIAKDTAGFKLKNVNEIQFGRAAAPSWRITDEGAGGLQFVKGSDVFQLNFTGNQLQLDNIGQLAFGAGADSWKIQKPAGSGEPLNIEQGSARIVLVPDADKMKLESVSEVLFGASTEVSPSWRLFGTNKVFSLQYDAKAIQFQWDDTDSVLAIKGPDAIMIGGSGKEWTFSADSSESFHLGKGTNRLLKIENPSSLPASLDLLENRLDNLSGIRGHKQTKELKASNLKKDGSKQFHVIQKGIEESIYEIFGHLKSPKEYHIFHAVLINADGNAAQQATISGKKKTGSGSPALQFEWQKNGGATWSLLLEAKDGLETGDWELTYYITRRWW